MASPTSLHIVRRPREVGIRHRALRIDNQSRTMQAPTRLTEVPRSVQESGVPAFQFLQRDMHTTSNNLVSTHCKLPFVEPFGLKTEEIDEVFFLSLFPANLLPSISSLFRLSIFSCSSPNRATIQIRCRTSQHM